MTAHRSATKVLQHFLPSPSRPLPSFPSFFSPSLALPSLPPHRASFFTPARSLPLSSSRALFTPSFSPSLASPLSRTPSSPSPFLHLRASFRRSSFLPSRPSSAPTLPGRRAFGTSSRREALRPYLGRGRGRGGYSYGGAGGPGGGPGGWRTFKAKVDALPGIWVIGGLIATNVAVYLVWNYAQQLAVRFRDSSLLRTMTRNFTVSWQNISNGRVWTLLTSAFSHEGTGHIIVNMASLFFRALRCLTRAVGGATAAILGNTGFLTLYLFSGLVSSVTSALFARFVAHNPWYSSHGASGSTFGCASFFACAFPREKFLLFFVLPVPAWLCVGGLFAWDLYGGLTRAGPAGGMGGTTDSMGHVGGMIAGALFFLRKMRHI
ncbi:hypothetical protein JCM8547_008809 [Rhodosporidiobolus lusitaniae]